MIRLHKNKFEVAKQTVRLEVGENRIRFSQTATESGMMTYDAICAATQDTRYDNNHASRHCCRFWQAQGAPDRRERIT